VTEPALATDDDQLVSGEEGAPGEPDAPAESQDPAVIVDSTVDENGAPL
jgi:hypothetical protein